MKKIFLPINILICALLILALGASYSWNGFDITLWGESFRNFIFIFFSGWFITFILVRLGLAAESRKENRIITSLILFLLFDAVAPWWIFILLGAVTDLMERLLRVPGGPLFNPAALGALFFSFFGYFPSWWGTNFSPRYSLMEGALSIATFVTIPFTFYVAYKYKKFWISLSALISFSIVYLLLFQKSPLFILLDGTLLFFLLVMAIEPKTTPIVTKDQLTFGLLIGVLIPLGMYFNWLEAYTLALLIGNLYTRRNFFFSLFVSSPPSSVSSPAA